MSYTKGPWVAENGGGRGSWIKGQSGEWAALGCGDTDETAEANARLIAAAPELAEALSAVLFWQAQGDYSALPMGAIHNQQAALETARAALAKAGVE